MSKLDGLSGELTYLPRESMHGLDVQIIKDSSVQRFDEKYEALREATRMIAEKFPRAFAHVPVLNVYMGKNLGAEAFWSPEGVDGSPGLLLGDTHLFRVNPLRRGQDPIFGMGLLAARGVADQLYDDRRRSKLSPRRWVSELRGDYRNSKTSAKVTAVVTHELGHVIHAHHSSSSKQLFWKNRLMSARLVPFDISSKVSSYTHANNYCEFVAEVFVGLVHGKSYSDDVMNDYQNYGGPA
jgi:hypothetical protein